jgi:hypothetical protein
MLQPAYQKGPETKGNGVNWAGRHYVSVAGLLSVICILKLLNNLWFLIFCL